MRDITSKRNYEELCIIGSGAYGTVFKAKDTENDRVVALKRVRIVNNTEEKGVPVSTLREITLLKQLDNMAHPNIVRMFDAFQTFSTTPTDSPQDLVLTIVFEHVEQDLSTFLHNSPGGLSEDVIKDLMHQLLSGVDYLHTNRMVHRDIKPQNILISKNKQVKIADFGLARVYGFCKLVTSVVVTLWYRAPEILLLAPYATMVDLWSVGTIMAEMYNRTPLFRGKSDVNQLHKILSIIGSPPKKEWPENVSLPWNSFNNYPGLELHDIIPGMCSDGIDLLNKVLVFNPNERLNARMCLLHPYFSNVDCAGSQDSGFSSQNSIEIPPFIQPVHQIRNENFQDDKYLDKSELNNQKSTALITPTNADLREKNSSSSHTCHQIDSILSNQKNCSEINECDIILPCTAGTHREKEDQSNSLSSSTCTEVNSSHSSCNDSGLESTETKCKEQNENSCNIDELNASFHEASFHEAPYEDEYSNDADENGDGEKTPTNSSTNNNSRTLSSDAITLAIDNKKLASAECESRLLNRSDSGIGISPLPICDESASRVHDNSSSRERQETKVRRPLGDISSSHHVYSEDKDFVYVHSDDDNDNEADNEPPCLTFRPYLNEKLCQDDSGSEYSNKFHESIKTFYNSYDNEKKRHVLETPPPAVINVEKTPLSNQVFYENNLLAQTNKPIFVDLTSTATTKTSENSITSGKTRPHDPDNDLANVLHPAKRMRKDSGDKSLL